jgi:hypothetical protein
MVKSDGFLVPPSLMTFLIIVICPSFPISRWRSFLVSANVIELEVRTMISKVIKDRDINKLFVSLILKLSIIVFLKINFRWEITTA